MNEVMQRAINLIMNTSARYVASFSQPSEDRFLTCWFSFKAYGMYATDWKLPSVPPYEEQTASPSPYRTISLLEAMVEGQPPPSYDATAAASNSRWIPSSVEDSNPGCEGFVWCGNLRTAQLKWRDFCFVHAYCIVLGFCSPPSGP